MQVDGILKRAFRTGKSIYAQIYGDAKGRFADGAWVLTSAVVSEEGDIFRTRYSAYKVESWAAGHEPANDNTPSAYSHAAAINLFAADCHAASRKTGWYTDPHTGQALVRNVPEMLCLIHSEISEAMEGFRKNLQDDKLPHRKMIEVELADAMIRIGDLATYLGLDVGGAIVEKMAFNAQREDHKLEARRAAGGKSF